GARASRTSQSGVATWAIGLFAMCQKKRGRAGGWCCAMAALVVVARFWFQNGAAAQSNLIEKSTFASPLVPPEVERGTNTYPRPVRNVFEAQLALARQGISCGSIDGLIGQQTQSALRVFQERENLPVTGEFDEATQNRLILAAPPLTAYTITPADLA